jgi:uncharacterized membrane protein
LTLVAVEFVECTSQTAYNHGVLPSHRGAVGLSGGSAFFAACAIWAAVLMGAPFTLAHRPGTAPAFKTATTAVYLLAGLMCHQQSDRSFHMQSVQWPVCARCAGLYLAAPLGAWLALRRTWRPPHAPAARHVLFSLAVAALPTALIFALEWTGAARLDAWIRALCAAPLGATIAFILGAVARGDLR